jgi:signal transduction histidine kinase
MGAESVSAVKKDFFDVILMDYNLPDMTGIDAIHKIREVNTESQILMLTAHASLDTALKAIQETVNDFLVKPVDFEMLKRNIAKSIDRLGLQKENRRLVDDLRKANEQMLYLSNMKSKFLSMASHDLSNVLMTMQVSFEMLMTTLKPDEEQAKRLGYISNGLVQLARLIEDLVDWASIEQGKFRLERKTHEPKVIVEESVGQIQARAGQRGITVDFSVDDKLPVVEADKRRLSQVLGNLLENAMRHTQKKGKVTVFASQKDKSILFCVKDTGEGIDPAELKKIFDSFYQPSTSSQSGRLGLGLSISREIIHSHGGEIWVESEGKGKGASFIFTVPCNKKK